MGSGVVVNPAIVEAIEWCQKARKDLLIKRTLRFALDKTDLGTVTPKVEKLLASLESAGLTHEHQALKTRFTTIAREINEVHTSGLSEDRQRASIKLKAEDLSAVADVQQQALTAYSAYRKDRLKAEKVFKKFLAGGGMALPVQVGMFRDRFSTADEHIDNRQYSEAGAQVSTVAITALIRAAQEELQALRSVDLDKERFQPVYEDKLERIDRSIIELQALPGTAKAVLALQTIRARGEAVLSSGGTYEKAKDKLDGVRKAVQKGYEAAAQFKKTGGNNKEFLAAQNAAQAALDAYDKFTRGSDPEAIKLGAEALREAGLLLSASPPQPDQAVQAAQEVTADYDRRLVALERRKKQQARMYGALDSWMEEYFPRWAPEKDYAELLPHYRAFKAIQSVGRYDDAEPVGVTVMAKAQTLRTTVRDRVTRWTNLSDQVEDGPLEVLNKSQYINGIIELIKGYNGVKHPTHYYLAYTVQRDQLSKTRDLVSAIASAQAVLDRAADFTVMLQKGQDLSRWRAEAQEAFDARLVPSLELVTAIQERRGSAAEQTAEIAGVQKTLTEELEAAFTQETVEAARDKALAAVGAPTAHGSLTLRLKQIRDELDAAIAGFDLAASSKHKIIKGGKIRAKQLGQAIEGGSLTHDSIQKADREAAEQELADQAAEQLRRQEALKDKLEPLLTTLYANDPASAVIRRGEYKAATDEADVALSIDALEAVEVQVNADIEAARGVLKAANTQAQQKLKALRKQLDKLQGDYGKFKPWFDGKRAEASTYEVVIEGENLLVTSRAIADLDALKVELDAQSDQDFQHVIDGFKALKVALNQKLVKDCLPSRQEALLLRIQKQWGPACYALPAAEAKALFDAKYKPEIDAVGALAVTRDGHRTRNAALAEQLKLQLSQNSALFKTAPKLKNSLEGTLKSAVEPGENGETTAENALKQAKVRIDKVIAQGDGSEQAVIWEGEIAQSEQKDRLDKAHWDAALAVFEKHKYRDAEAAKGAVGDTADLNRWKELEDTYKDAKDLGGKGMYDRALQKLEVAGLQAVVFTKDPHDTSKVAADRLWRSIEGWRLQALAFTRDMSALIKSVQEAIDSEQTLTGGLVIRQLDEVRVFFDASIFDGIEKEMRKAWFKKPRDQKTLRAQKEKALRHIRRYQDYLKKEPLLARIEDSARNPFGPVNFEKLRYSLENLELHFKHI